MSKFIVASVYVAYAESLMSVGQGACEESFRPRCFSQPSAYISHVAVTVVVVMVLSWTNLLRC